MANEIEDSPTTTLVQQSGFLVKIQSFSCLTKSFLLVIRAISLICLFIFIYFFTSGTFFPQLQLPLASIMFPISEFGPSSEDLLHLDCSNSFLPFILPTNLKGKVNKQRNKELSHFLSKANASIHALNMIFTSVSVSKCWPLWKVQYWPQYVSAEGLWGLLKVTESKSSQNCIWWYDREEAMEEITGEWRSTHWGESE